MRQVQRTHESAGFAIEDAPVPPLLEDGAIVRVRRSLVSDVLAGALGKTGPLWATGESCAGTVVATGRAGDLPSVGARVACAGPGFANHAEYVSVPRNLLVRVPPALSWEEACFAGPGAVALHALRRSEAGLGEWVLVSGLGLVGLLAVQIARASGWRTIALDEDEARLALARSLGAEAIFLLKENVPQEVRELTRGGADRLLVAGSQGAAHALRALRRRGRAVLLSASLGHEQAALEGEVELVLAGSPGPGFQDSSYEERGIDYPIAYVRWTESRNMAEVLRLIAERRIYVSSLSGSVRPLEEAPRVLASARSLPCSFLDFPEREEAPLDRLPEARAPLAPSAPAGTASGPGSRRPPWARKLRDELSKRGGATFLVCRAGEGAGSIADALARWIEVLGFLAGDPRPRALEVAGTEKGLAVLLRWENGAIASVVLSPGAGARLEAFKGGACFVQEDQGPLEAWGEGAEGGAFSSQSEVASPEEALWARETARLVEERARALPERVTPEA